MTDTYNLIESTMTEGEFSGMLVTVSGAKWTPVKFYREWFDCTLFNDGPDTAYIQTTSGTANDVPLNKQDQIKIKAKRGSEKPVWLRCSAGESASVRFVFEW